jgi:hypothetical protein
LPLDTWQSGSIEGQKSSGIRANYLLFRRLAELSVLNVHLISTIPPLSSHPVFEWY